MDPAADGILKVGAAVRVVGRHRNVPFVGYMPLTYQHMKAVAILSREGLAHALLHPLREGLAILRIANELCARRLAYEFLQMFEIRLTTLSPDISTAVRDLLERPQRYYSVGDLGQQSSHSTRQLYRLFDKARLGSPKKLVTAAKILRAYAYLRSGATIPSIAKEIGYTPRTLHSQMHEILQCSPLHLRHEPSESKVVLQIIQWMDKLRDESLPRYAQGVPLRAARDTPGYC